VLLYKALRGSYSLQDRQPEYRTLRSRFFEVFKLSKWNTYLIDLGMLCMQCFLSLSLLYADGRFSLIYCRCCLYVAKGKGIKGKVVPVLFNCSPRHEDVLGEWRCSSTHYLASALDGGELSASRPGRFTLKGKSSWYPLDRRLGGPQSRSECGGKEKHSQPLLLLEPPTIQPVAQHYTPELSRLLLY
jgi:hypothetical protein